MNQFLRPVDDYVRDLDIVKHAKEDMAFGLHKATGKPIEDCRAYVEKEWSPTGKFPFRDPRVRCTKRVKGSRNIEVIRFSEYLGEVSEKNYILSPSLTVLLPPRILRSKIGKYMEKLAKLRASDKAGEKEAQMRRDKDMENYKRNMQTCRKLRANSTSGAMVSDSTPLFNKTGHSVLTSTCRSGTGYGNSHNERFITGNRHYWAMDIVYSSLSTICRYTDMKALRKTINKYNLVIPTVEDVMDCITYSLFLYHPRANLTTLRTMVDRLTDMERAAFVYIGDLYHLKKHNPEIVRTLLTKLIVIAESADRSYLTAKVDFDEAIMTLASIVCSDYLNKRMVKDVRVDDEDVYLRIVGTYLHIEKELEGYGDLIESLWRSDNAPISVAKLPNSIRRAAIVSDTDSTIFTVQKWVEWFYDGHIPFHTEAKAVSNSIVYMTSQIVRHFLALMSSNAGVEKDKIFSLNMKNEFFFEIFFMSPRAKHYAARQLIKEGNVLPDPVLELKGVEYRDSNVPAHVNALIRDTLNWIFDEISSKGKVSVMKILKVVYEVETAIEQSILDRKIDYLRRARVKPPEGYIDGEDQHAYQSYVMWQEVFAPKYGTSPEPEYRAVSFGVDLSSKTKLQRWLAGIKDKELVGRMQNWLNTVERDKLTNIYLPEEIVLGTGIPEEFDGIIDIQKSIFGCSRSFYLILAAFGIYLINDNLTKLVKDVFNQLPVNEPLKDLVLDVGEYTSIEER